MDIHIEDNGSGPAVLFIHAGVADSRMWRGQLLPGYRTVTFDKRGFGETQWIPGPFSDTDDSLAVLDATGIDSATIVGCSMGGATALDLAINHPDRVDALVLVGAYPSGWEPPGGFDETPLEEEAAAAAAAQDFDRVVEIDYLMWVVGYGRDEAGIDPAHRELFFDMDARPVRTQTEREEYQTGFRTRLNDHIDSIDVPTLVMVGAHDEPVLIAAAGYLASRLSDDAALIIPDAAHLPSMERPEEFNRLLLAFLDAR